MKFGDKTLKNISDEIKIKSSQANDMLFREKEAEKQEMDPFENYGLQDVTQMSWNKPMDYSYGAFTNEGEWNDGTMGTGM